MTAAGPADTPRDAQGWRGSLRPYRPTVVLALILLPGCGFFAGRDSGPTPGRVDVSKIPDAEPREEPRSRYGNPESYEVFGRRYYVMKDARGYVERGIASWYGEKFHGRRTSSGETYDMYAMTAAHKTLPLPTYVEVTNLKNGKSVVVRVNDRGPFHDNRIIDLSYAAAAKLDIVGAGTGLVEVRAIDPKAPRRKVSKVTPAPSASGGSGFYVQVGAFANRSNAERVFQKLRGFGNDLLHISEVLIDGRVLYRVRIGPLYEVDTADRVVASLGRLGIYDHHIVTE